MLAIWIERVMNFKSVGDVSYRFRLVKTPPDPKGFDCPKGPVIRGRKRMD